MCPRQPLTDSWKTRAKLKHDRRTHRPRIRRTAQRLRLDGALPLPRRADAIAQHHRARGQGTRILFWLRQFEALTDGRYVLRVPGIGAEVEVDRLRREHHQLIGELAVRCSLPGALTYDGVVSVGDFNLSSVTTRKTRASLISERVQAPEIDWVGILEELVQRVLSAERAGQPAVDLRDLPKPQRDEIEVVGFTLPRRHPSSVFGDGGSAKSYTALLLAGTLAKQGHQIALFDWELAGEDHRERLELLFGADMPRITYARCERPLTAEADRLRRIVRDNGIEYAVFDSVVFACDGPPESAETAGRYFRAVRELGIGSLHIAHITKAGEGNDQRPFGSAFWHNGFRCTWFCKAAETSGNENTLDLGFYNRKANLGPMRPPLGFTITFTETETTYRRSSVGDSPDLAIRMNAAQRIQHLLKGGALPMKDISETLDIPLNTVTQTVNRYTRKGHTFEILEGKRVGLKAR